LDRLKKLNGWIWNEEWMRLGKKHPSDFPSQLWIGEKSSTLSYKSHQVAVFSSSQDMIGVSGCFPDEALGDESFPDTNTQDKTERKERVFLCQT